MSIVAVSKNAESQKQNATGLLPKSSSCAVGFLVRLGTLSEAWKA